MTLQEQTTSPPYCYDEQGEPIYHGDAYLRTLWTNIAKCGLENRVEESKFDPQLFYRPIQAALSHIDALLTVVQECRKTDGKVSLLKGEPDKAKLVVSHDRRSIYMESAAALRKQAQLLLDTFTRFETFLGKYVRPLILAGYQVDYTSDSVWVVDFGYKQMFAKFGSHFDPVIVRGNYAVINLNDKTGKLEYKFPQVSLERLIYLREGREEGLVDLFPVHESLCHDDEFHEFAKLLSKYRQSVLEKDLYEHIIKSKLLNEDNVELKECETVNYCSKDLLSIVHTYLSDHQ